MLNEFIIIFLVCLHRNKRTNLFIDLFHHHYGVIGIQYYSSGCTRLPPVARVLKFTPSMIGPRGSHPDKDATNSPRTAKENLADSSLCQLFSQESSNSIQPFLLDGEFIDLFFLSTFLFRETLYTITMGKDSFAPGKLLPTSSRAPCDTWPLSLWRAKDVDMYEGYNLAAIIAT
jgi:hypothetical protein